MPSHGGATTRRERYKWIRRKYLNRRRKWLRYSWRWRKNLTTPKSERLYRKWIQSVGPVVPQRCIVALSYDADIPLPWPLGLPYSLTPAGRAMPPHIKNLFLPYIAAEAAGKHHQDAWLGYHLRPVKSRGKRTRNTFWTAHNRRIMGGNWVFFRTGWYADDDVLGRRPNDTDRLNGVPTPGTLWPVPSGF